MEEEFDLVGMLSYERETPSEFLEETFFNDIGEIFNFPWKNPVCIADLSTDVRTITDTKSTHFQVCDLKNLIFIEGVPINTIQISQSKANTMQLEVAYGIGSTPRFKDLLIYRF